MTKLKNHKEFPHEWEKIKMSTGKTVISCKDCLYAYDFGFDLPCPAKMPKKII